MTEEKYRQFLKDAQNVDAELERRYGNEIFIPRKLNERQVERIRQLEREIDDLKRNLREHGINIP